MLKIECSTKYTFQLEKQNQVLGIGHRYKYEQGHNHVQ